MAGEITTPLLPCASIEEITRFYEAEAAEWLCGNWLRVHKLARPEGQDGEAAPRDASRSTLAAALHGAALLGDSKGDFRAAAQLLDAALARETVAPATDQIAALVYRAELAISLDDRPGAARFLAQMGAIPLDEAARGATQADLERATDLQQALAAEHGDDPL